MSTEPETEVSPIAEIERQSMDVDIACAGFGPATGGFLTTLVQAWNENPADPAFVSKVAPGLPLQVLCYERADDLAAGVSGVVTKARGISASFPALNPAEIPMAANVTSERVLYLLDPIGASRRSALLRFGDALLRVCGGLLLKDHAFELPCTPAFLNKHGGLVLSIGQFNQWVASQLMSSGLVQIWPGTPVSAPLREGDAVTGLRLADQGVDTFGRQTDSYMPGTDVRARLTVVGDGPVGQIGRALNENKDQPRDWALGMKFVIELPDDFDCNQLVPGTVWHTFGYPEPEIFGFMYAHPGRLVSVGIFVPSWLGDPSRTVYRYLQHYIQHPALWRVLKNGTLQSWGAKSLEDSGRHAEPALTGDGFARIGEGSGSTNMLTGSGVDEAWTTGTQLGEAVLDLLRNNQPFTHENLAATYEARRRASWVEHGAREAENARNGFHGGIVKGMIGMALAGLTGGRLSMKSHIPPASQPNTVGAPSIARSVRNGWDMKNPNPTAQPGLTPSRAPSIARSVRNGWDMTNPNPTAQPGLIPSRAPSIARSVRNGWDMTNPNPTAQPGLIPSRAPSIARSVRNGCETPLDKADVLAAAQNRPLHDALLTVRGWPEITFDGRLLITQQDALLIGGKVQATPGFADHVRFRDLKLCADCNQKTCVAMCSGQAITEDADGLPIFEREKCIHCGGCLWNCATENIEFNAGSGGLHSAEN